GVGWGWLGYHAFLAADRLAQFVPPLLGLRDGIFYSEWLPQDAEPSWPARTQIIDDTADYVAGRVRALRQPRPADLRGSKGADILSTVLSRAWGWKVASVLKRPRVE